MVDAGHVVRRLAELRDWVEYVHESLVRDQPYEIGKLQRLSELLREDELKELRVSSYFLARRLSELLARVAVDAAGKAAGRTSIPR
jgi:hypothetical protein